MNNWKPQKLNKAFAIHFDFSEIKKSFKISLFICWAEFLFYFQNNLPILNALTIYVYCSHKTEF